MATLAPPAAACCPPAASGEGKHVRLGKTLRCPDCPRTYHNKFSLLVHRRLQHEHPSPYSCNECGLSFPQARSSTTRRLPTTSPHLVAITAARRRPLNSRATCRRTSRSITRTCSSSASTARAPSARPAECAHTAPPPTQWPRPGCGLSLSAVYPRTRRWVLLSIPHGVTVCPSPSHTHIPTARFHP